MIRPIRKALALALAALALAGCEAMPIGPYDRPQFAADPAAGPYTFFFTPDAATLAPGEPQRLSSYLKTLSIRPTEDILLEVGNSGNAVLDARRLMTLRQTFAGSRARVRVFVPHAVPDPDTISNAVKLTLVRYDLIIVECPPQDTAGDLTTPLPPLGCANAINVATMAVDKRDLMAPAHALEGSEAGASAAAVERHRAGKVRTLPININGG